MKIKSELLSFFHLDKTYSLLNGKHVKILLDIFKFLDIHGTHELNDVQFMCFMQAITDLTESQIYKVFDMFDVDGSGDIDFDEFYLLMCIMISVKDSKEKQFIWRHSRTVFDLLDIDGSNTITSDEFEDLGFLFNLPPGAVKTIFSEFDISGDQELDYKEFRMFAMACIDKHNELEKERKLRRDRRIEKARQKARKSAKKEILKQQKKQQQQQQQVASAAASSPKRQISFGRRIQVAPLDMDDIPEDELLKINPTIWPEIKEEDYDEEGKTYIRPSGRLWKCKLM